MTEKGSDELLADMMIWTLIPLALISVLMACVDMSQSSKPCQEVRQLNFEPGEDTSWLD